MSERTVYENDAAIHAALAEKVGDTYSPANLVLRSWVPVGGGLMVMVVPAPHEGYYIETKALGKGLTDDPSKPIRAEAEETGAIPVPRTDTTPSLQDEQPVDTDQPDEKAAKARETEKPGTTAKGAKE